MSLQLQNTVLRAAEAGIEKQIPENVREPYLKIVVSGLKVALNGGQASPFAKLVRESKDPIRDSVNGAVSLVMQMRSEAKGEMPLDALVPATAVLMLKALDLFDKSKRQKIGNAELDQAMFAFNPTLFKALGITDEMLNEAVGKANALVKDPQAVAKMEQAGGLKVAPGAKSAAQAGGANGV